MLLHNFNPVCQKINKPKNQLAKKEEKLQPPKIMKLNTSQKANLENEKDQKRSCAEKITYCKC